MSARNPYLDHDLDQLATSAGARAAQLRERRARSPEDRAQLAEDTAQLLLAVHHRLGAVLGEESPGAPGKEQRRGASLVEAYVGWAGQREREIRHQALVLATDRHLGVEPHPWYLSERLGGQLAYDVALADLAGLQAVLEVLAAKPRGRR